VVGGGLEINIDEQVYLGDELFRLSLPDGPAESLAGLMALRGQAPQARRPAILREN